MADKNENKRFIDTDDVNFQSTGVDIEGSHFKPGPDGKIIETFTGWDDKTDELHHELPYRTGHHVLREDGITVLETVIFQHTGSAAAPPA